MNRSHTPLRAELYRARTVSAGCTTALRPEPLPALDARFHSVC